MAEEILVEPVPTPVPVLDTTLISKTIGIPDEWKYTTEIFESPIGKAEITVEGPLGAAAILVNTDFDDINPGQIVQGVGMIVSLFPGYGQIIGAVISMIGGMIEGLTAGPSSAELMHGQVMEGISALADGLRNISLQMQSSFDSLRLFQLEQMTGLKTFILQLSVDKQVAWSFMIDILTELQTEILLELEQINFDSRFKIDALYADAITISDLELSTALSQLQADYFNIKVGALAQLSPFFEKISIKLIDIDREFIVKLYLLKLILDEIELIRNFDVKVDFTDPLLTKYWEPLYKALILTGKFPQMIIEGTELPGRKFQNWNIPFLAIGQRPTPENIDYLISYKEKEMAFEGKIAIIQFLDYLGKVFGTAI